MLELVRDGSPALKVYGLVAGLRLELLDTQWVAFSPESGETLLLNNEAAAVLELLAAGALSDGAVCDLLSAETGADHADVAAGLASVWPQMLSAGFIQLQASAADNGG